MNEMSLKERLVLAIKEKGMSIRKFETLAQTSNGFVSNISHGIGADKLLSILSVMPDINVFWLVRGEGEMWEKNKLTQKLTVEYVMQMREDDRQKWETKVDQLDNQISDLIEQNKTLTEVIRSQQSCLANAIGNQPSER